MKFFELVEAHAEYKAKSNMMTFKNYRQSKVWDLKDLNEGTVKENILGFLNKWGVYRVSYSVAPQLTQALKEVKSDIQYFKGKKLLQDLTLDHKQQEYILRIFSKIGDVKGISGVGIAKILHMCCPQFFIMWDNAIAENYGCSINAQGYMNFLWITKSLINKNGLQKEYVISDIKDITLLKLIDEFNMMRKRARMTHSEHFL